MVIEKYEEETKTIVKQNEALKREIGALKAEKLKTISLTAK
jgi:hypothetical protein